MELTDFVPSTHPNGYRWSWTSNEDFGENWRMDDEWWRQPIVRRYVEVVLEGGGRVVLFEDLITGEWFVQMPT